MSKFVILFISLLFVVNVNFAQKDNFKYSVSIKPVSIPNLPGLHSFVTAHSNGKWLVIGGRKDGSHARQPFRAFPGDENNTLIYVIDVKAKKYWSASVNELPISLKEQMQSGNMNYFQDGKILYITGGYAYSASEDDHITFPYLTSVSVPELINSVINGNPVSPYFKQIKDYVFAVTGGQMGKIGNTFYLVGGQRFDGRYNPMGHRTYKQTYTDGIRKFKIQNTKSKLSYSEFEIITDQAHFHRRDFNLLPQIFPDGSFGYTVSSGVFQANADLPFFYPVDITASDYTPVTSFNQYLSNYHTAKVSLFDKKNNQMNTVFFGGISQYYFDGNDFVTDLNVPYVKTISRLSRYADGTLREFVLPVEMPMLAGANGEFIPLNNIPSYSNGILNLNKIRGDSVIIGFIYGGIISTELNPFSRNNLNSTYAGNLIFEVSLINYKTVQDRAIDGSNPFSAEVFYEGTDLLSAVLNIPYNGITELTVTDRSGKIVFQKTFKGLKKGMQTIVITNNKIPAAGECSFNFMFDYKFAFTKKVLVE
ncbi:MAG TPA: hypothetical protein PK536_02150 [Ignavibacteria bacterium]|nr:hypothetical protein [Bacteroidota bacterium]HRI84229.1 hypothetical protein [Ignavibacteria bacterium]